MTTPATRSDGGSRTALLAVLAVSIVGCAALTIPRLEFPPTARRIVVVVPGMTGVELEAQDAGRAVWGRSANLFCPHDGGYRLAAEGLRPGRAIPRMRFGPLVKPIYAPIERLFVDNGWTRGDLAAPRADTDLFFFEYDWRHGNSRSANLLAQRLESLAATRGHEIGVSLVCQSNGALICRYLAKFGAAPIDRATAGAVERIPGVRIEQLVLVGTANGGSLRALRFMNRGRRYVPLVGRTFQPELFFTFESLYQDLPAYADDLFLDETGRRIDVDLFDPAAWSRYGWSIEGAGARRRLERARAREVFPPATERPVQLASRLSRARQLRALLDRDVDLGGVRYFSIQNDRIPTPARAVLRSTSSGWQTLFLGDREIRGALAARLAAEGDGHATVSSQRWLPPSEQEAFAEPALRANGPHFEMILEPEAMRYLLSVCAAPPTAASAPSPAAQAGGAPTHSAR